MQSPTITMEKDKALAKLEQYEEAVRKNPHARTSLDRQIAQGYRVLARGGRLVDVNEALRAGGLNLAGIPKLAISRAHVVEAVWRPSGATNASHGRYSWHQHSRWDERYFGDRFSWGVPEGTFTGGKLNDREHKAMTPYIPLPLRPVHKLENYFLLWEANWHPAPPVDPYLLRPVAGSLMEIIAEWDVTPLELAAVSDATQRQRR